MNDDQERWSTLRSGYKVPYDPRPTVARLRGDPLCRDAWSELFQELHHQGDLGDASYAAIPLVVDACAAGPRDWQFYGLVAIIETERHHSSNPAVPSWLVEIYDSAIQRARALALDDLGTSNDPEVVQAALAVVALASGCMELGAMLTHMDTNDVAGWLEDRG